MRKRQQDLKNRLVEILFNGDAWQLNLDPTGCQSSPPVEGVEWVCKRLCGDRKFRGKATVEL